MWYGREIFNRAKDRTQPDPDPLCENSMRNGICRTVTRNTHMYRNECINSFHGTELKLDHRMASKG